MVEYRVPNIGYKHTEESKEKIKLAMKGKYIGSDNPFFDKKHTSETKLKISKFLKGKKQTREHALKRGLTRRKTNKERLSRYSIDANGCWVWTGSRNSGGYGIVGKGHGLKGSIVAHRLSFMEFVGEIPKTMNVLHKCDMPPCINPKHLFLGTQKDNVRDMIKKERSNSKISSKQAEEIRRSYKDGAFQKDLAENYKISQSAISLIIRNKHHAVI